MSGALLRTYNLRMSLADSGKTINHQIALYPVSFTLTVKFTTSGGGAGPDTQFRVLVITGMTISSAYSSALYVGSNVGYISLPAKSTSTTNNGAVFQETFPSSGATPKTNVTIYVRKGSATGDILASKTLEFTQWGSSQTFEI